MAVLIRNQKSVARLNLNRAFHPCLMVQECPETANREPPPICEGRIKIRLNVKLIVS